MNATPAIDDRIGELAAAVRSLGNGDGVVLTEFGAIEAASMLVAEALREGLRDIAEAIRDYAQAAP